MAEAWSGNPRERRLNVSETRAMNVVFMGSEDFSLPILRALTMGEPTTPTTVAGVVTQPDRPAGRGRKVTPNPVKAFAVQCGVPVLQPERLRDEASVASVLQLEPDLIVVASYGQIVPRVLLDEPTYRSLNLHPSLLPKYRGASPVTGAILAGDEQTGATLMLMAPRMDAGPILAQEPISIGVDETAGELEARLAVLSASLLRRQLSNWLTGVIRPRDQAEAEATYTTRLEKYEGSIDWQQPAELIARRVRAFNPWPTAFTSWGASTVRILRARALGGEAPPGKVRTDASGSFTVGTGAGLLSIEQMQLAGGRPLPPLEIVRGHETLATAVLGGPSPW